VARPGAPPAHPPFPSSCFFPRFPPRQVIDRILFKLDELVRPYCHKILVVIEPLLIDEDYYARVEGRWAALGSQCCWHNQGVTAIRFCAAAGCLSGQAGYTCRLTL
jgi:hypothetical protein